MPEFKLNGKTYSGSTSYASAIDYTETDGSKTTVQDKISEMDENLEQKVQYVSITGTTGTGDSVGMINVPLTQYPNAKAIIPLGLDITTSYNVYGYATGNSFIIGVMNTSTRAWASGVSVTFYALVIY